uniref:Uncharacterized protein n=1 Tax=Oryza sativa subsp. japonica TaxID=39947 RepID=Q6ZGW1_ORYSJ|nr:hypothetical protein [Oryza sativa Japonica Group]BAD12913.1 hypothetical protein [Oryza sativa Japonica Group]
MGLIPVLSDMVAEPAWNPRGPHMSVCPCMALGLAPTVARAAKGWCGWRRWLPGILASPGGDTRAQSGTSSPASPHPSCGSAGGARQERAAGDGLGAGGRRSDGHRGGNRHRGSRW